MNLMSGTCSFALSCRVKLGDGLGNFLLIHLLSVFLWL